MLRPYDYNFDNQSICGSATLIKKIYETVPEHKVISFSARELINNGVSPMDKVNFLIGKGSQHSPFTTSLT